MSTTVTADDLLAALKRRGVPFRFYKDKADFLVHNRNHAGANTSVTPGGFGPIRGVVAHTTAMTASEATQMRYLYTGDGEGSSKPGPLCLGGIAYDGTVVLMGWGTATHCGPGDPKTMKLAIADAMPLDREVAPLMNGTNPLAVAVNPFFLGFEVCGTSVNAKQRKTLTLASAAILEMLGGPTAGYSGGSLVMHREWTTNRSDPQGIPKDGVLRREVNALLRGFAATELPPTAPKPTTVTVTLSAQRITAGQVVTVTSTVTPAVAGVHVFEWSYPGSGVWKEFARVTSSTGKATAKSTPGSDIVYRVRFGPTDKAYAIDWSPNVALDVVTLGDVVKLEATVASQAATIEALKAGTPPPETATAERLAR